MYSSLEKKKYLVTGASSGIGREVAKILSEYGAYVFLNGRKENELHKTRQEMQGEGHLILPFSLGKIEAVADCVKAIGH